jgi:toluene monooxygenase system protein E
MELRASMSAEQRTYWHLEALRRVPSDYDVASSRLLYYPGREFAIDSPVTEWYERFQKRSRLQLVNGDQFVDPRETTYTAYTKLANERETFVDGLFRAGEEANYDARLPADWVEQLDDWLPVLLYPGHGFQMVASYLAQMAPAGRVVMVGLFQAADELRRIQRIAYRVRQLQKSHPEFGHDGKRAWQERPEWQPLRKLVEELLVTYDFGEAFVAFSLVVKPLFDRLFLHEFARLAESYRDTLLAKLFFSFEEDARWQRTTALELARFAIEEQPANRAVIAEFVGAHLPPTLEALAALAPLWTSATDPWSRVLRSLQEERAEALGELGVEGGGGR